MIENKLVSVIVPVYNVEPYLEECIESITNQTYKNIEVILIDDGSNDRSGIICDEAALKDSRIKVLHKSNGGLASARNAGLAIASGDYVGFVDSDDWIAKDMYEHMLSSIERNNASIACCGRTLVYSNKYCKIVYSLETEKIWSGKQAMENLFYWNAIDSSACDKLFKRSLFDGIKFPEGRLHEDIFTIYKVLNLSKTVIHVGHPYYFYRQRIGGITRNKYSHRKMDLLDALDEMKLFIESSHEELMEQFRAFSIVNVDIVLYQFNQDKSNRKNFESDFRRINEMFNFYSKGYLKNKYISRQEKIKVMIAKLNLTNAYIKLKDLYLKIRA